MDINTEIEIQDLKYRIEELEVEIEILKEEIKNERKRIWNELCKGRSDGAFASTLELEEDNVYDIIFNDKKYKF